MWLCMCLISNNLCWDGLCCIDHSSPRWKNGRNTWRVSQSPCTGTGNLFGVAGVFGCMSWWDHKIQPQKIFQLGLLAEGHVWPWACSKWTAFWEGQPHQVEIQSQAHQLRMRTPRNWFIWWILIHQVWLVGLKFYVVWKKSSMPWVWASSFRCLQKVIANSQGYRNPSSSGCLLQGLLFTSWYSTKSKWGTQVHPLARLKIDYIGVNGCVWCWPHLGIRKVLSQRHCHQVGPIRSCWALCLEYITWSWSFVEWLPKVALHARSWWWSSCGSQRSGRYRGGGHHL